MEQSYADAWTPTLRDLWSRIEQHPLEPGHSLDFTRRLARDKNWSLAFARGAILEYRRFCFLAAATAEPVTPSEEVDEVWHMHLTYTRDYWDVWCGTVLGKPLHHDPTQGNVGEQAYFRTQYAKTLALYERYFGPPAAEFWPATHVRFARSRYRGFNTDEWLLAPRPKALWRQLVATLRRQ